MSDETKAMTVQERRVPGEYTPEQVDIISRTVASGLSKDELKIFIHICQRTGLCALNKQIYAIKRKDKMCIQTSIDGFRLIAERTGKYSPGRETEYLYDEKGFVLASRVHIKKMTSDGTWHEMSNTAFMEEFKGLTPFWTKMPRIMLAKCSEAAILRRAFPADLGGIYVSEEMDQADVVEVKIEKDPYIDEATYSMLDAYLNGYDDLRNKLKKLCNVSDLRKIRISQLPAVREYTRRYIAELKANSTIVQQTVGQTQEEAYNAEC